MKRFWKSTALLLALLIAPAMAHCILESADVVADAFHCSDDAPSSTTHDEGGCAPCQVESASVKAEQGGMDVPQPEFQVVYSSAPAQPEAIPRPAFHPALVSQDAPPASAWTVHARRALPIRAPVFPA